MVSGKEVRIIRKRLGLTQPEFGEIFYQTRQAVGAWENGRVKVPAAYVPVMEILRNNPNKGQTPLQILAIALTAHFNGDSHE